MLNIFIFHRIYVISKVPPLSHSVTAYPTVIPVHIICLLGQRKPEALNYSTWATDFEQMARGVYMSGYKQRGIVMCRGAGRSIIGGANIHIFVFGTINFF